MNLTLIKYFFSLLTALMILGSQTAYAGTCTGSPNCHACKSCRYCKHCAKEGGTCGVCGGNYASSSNHHSSGIPWWVWVGGAVAGLYAYGYIAEKVNRKKLK